MSTPTRSSDDCQEWIETLFRGRQCELGVLLLVDPVEFGWERHDHTGRIWYDESTTTKTCSVSRTADVITAYPPKTTATTANQIRSGFTHYPPALNRAAILNSTSSALASMLAASTSDDTRPSSSRSASNPTV